MLIKNWRKINHKW